ncbi:MAG: SDR family NAD(P)-dependent oxidoreductase [Planctomycetota bacterium]|nr:SDR family NAD(P)-dependent oxidoreductase [Planctomycetota bacterium]
MSGSSQYEIGPNDVAIVGRSARVPSCPDVDSFWRALRDGEECIKPYTDEQLLEAGVEAGMLADPNYVKAGGHLEQMEYFDASFFGFSPKDAGITDPQHRHFYECVWEAMENAGHTSRNFDGSIGVFAGCGPNMYFMRNVMTNPDLVRSVGYFLLRHTGNDRDFLPTGISYKLNFRGPSVAVQTACSTSLVATHMACQSLLNGECDMALAGGVTISLPHRQGYLFRESEILDPTGHCRAFDANSAGTVITSGVGVVILRRLEDALEDGDHIHAIIKGSAINNDGANKVGYLAPSVEGHAEVVAEALALAGLEADDISYLETHGTGTAVGDPIEIAALTEAFRRSTKRTQFCPVGSVKASIGHTDTAAGVVGMIKVVESLKHRHIPKSLNYESPNPHIDFATSPFFVNAEGREWKSDGQPRRAGISSLGVGGTNAHVIVEESPESLPSDAARPWETLILSAKTKTALEARTDQLAEHLKSHPELNLSDVAHTLQIGREPFEHRRIVAVQSLDDAISTLQSRDPQRIASGKCDAGQPSIVFMFPGGGAQYPNMGRELYETESVYREAIDECLRLLSSHIDFDLKSMMYPISGNEEQAAKDLRGVTASICSIFSTSYATAQLWISRGVEPESMTGHSLGEYVAACLAGVFSLDDALKIVALRGKVLGNVPGASMLSVALPEDEVRALLGDDLDLSAINGPEFCLVSGTDEQIDALQKTLEEREVDCRKLLIAAASHCRLLEPSLDEFRAGLQSITLHQPQKRFICNVTGTWAKPDDVTDPEYWVRHFRQPVRFSQGLAELLTDPNRVLLEVGPGTTLGSLARQQPAKPRSIVASLRHPTDNASDMSFFLTAEGRLWLAGFEVDWKGQRGGARRLRVPLPTYPFERQRYWIEPGQTLASEAITPAVPPITKLHDMDDWFYRMSWASSPKSKDTNKTEGTIVVFADATGLGSEIAKRLRDQGSDVVLVREGDAYYKFNDHEYALAPEEGRVGYDDFFADLANHEKGSRLPSRIVHCWMVTTEESFRAGSSFFHRNQERGYFSLVFLMKALGELDHHEALHLDIVSNGMQAVGDEAVRYADKATLLGPVRVIPHEFGHVSCRSIDLDLAPASSRDKGQADPFNEAVDAVLAEVRGEVANEIIAYREKTRYIETIEQSSVPDVETSRFREAGVYLITGGLGGIGLKIAEHLAANYQANLVLLGRRELPLRESWDTWLESHSEQDGTSRRIETIRRLEQLGGKVLPATADVANIERMQAVIAETLDHFGTIHGVIHAAAVLEDGVIQAKSVEAMERVFTPKVHGTLLLADLFEKIDLDFFLMFSSTSAMLGPAGQVDYTAANCFLNALAKSEGKTARNFITIDWGVWKDVGAGRDIAQRIKGEDVDEDYLHRCVDHPLLDECLIENDDEIVFATNLKVSEHWLLDEHRTKAGQAIVPGTGYLEFARCAAGEALGSSNFEIRDLSFITPLLVNDDETRELRLTLTRDKDRYGLEIKSRSSGAWTTHATGRVKTSAAKESTIDLEAIRQRCTDIRGSNFKHKQSDLLAFGPRWDVLKGVAFGPLEAIADLELNESFASDLESYQLHPALMDLATGFALPLIEGYQEAETLYVPLSYECVRIHGPLTRRVVSHIRGHATNNIDQDIATFDIVITDEAGRVLVEIDRFVVRKIENTLSFGLVNLDAQSASGQPHLSEGEKLFLETLECGILADEGMQTMERALASPGDGLICVSSIDLPMLIEREGEVHDDPDESGVKFDRPDLQSEFEAPRDEIERILAGYWEDLLGVSDIGIQDDFFELGGHSLIAVRLFAKIKKKWSVEYPISVLFQAPTIGAGADMLRDELGVTLGDEAPSEPKARKPVFKYLVPMNKAPKSDKPPFFLVAGMFGNVLNLRHLAAHLGDDQPVYAVQARGLHGDDKPHTRFEDMARDYLEEIRTLQPHGPYYLGGFSGGGITAYEMAQQLLAQGDEIGILMLLDSPPARVPLANKLERLLIQGIHFKEQGLNYPVTWAKKRWAWEKRRFQPNERELTPAEFRSEEIEAGFREACDVYQHRPYPGKVNLFRPALRERYVLGAKRILNEDREYVDHENHWAQFVEAVDVHIVTGDHDSMVLEPHVRVLAAEMKSCLAKAQKDHTPGTPGTPGSHGSPNQSGTSRSSDSDGNTHGNTDTDHAQSEPRPQYQ